jgi:hypothetical protein
VAANVLSKLGGVARLPCTCTSLRFLYTCFRPPPRSRTEWPLVGTFEVGELDELLVAVAGFHRCAVLLECVGNASARRPQPCGGRPQ